MEETSQRVALVTGATAGLGKAIAAELGRRGWWLCLQHADAGPAGDEAAAELTAAAKAGGHKIEAEAFAADLEDTDQREQLVENALETFDRIDLFAHVPAALSATAGDLLEITPATFEQAVAGQLAPALFLTQLVANEMVRLVEGGLVEGAKIVLVNSISAYTTSADHAAHCVARAGLGMLTRLFADRLGEHGINVYEVRAGILSAGPHDPAHARYDELIEQGLTPIRRWGRPADVARAVAAVAEDLLPFSTGEVINVDGGFHLRRL